VGVTPQGWMRGWDEDGLVRPVDWADADRVLAKADAVIISEDDVAHKSVIDEWAAKARMLVVTLGDRGCDVYRQGELEPFHSAAFTSGNEVDPTGAGDVFAAAFLWHLHKSGGDWKTAADWANCVASFVVEKRGVGGVPKLAEVEKRWRSGSRVKVPVATSTE
jgi:sugar/nucleoside kinase (ribokinase family)